jgi:sedoheptulokinase
MQVMGIDVGTTTISIVLLDGDSGNLIAWETINHKSFIKGEYSFNKVQDPERIWTMVQDKKEKLIQQYGNPVCIGLTGQMHGMLYVDQYGTAVSPLYTWQDGSGNEMFQDGNTYADILRERVGAAATGYGLTTHFYLQKKGLIPENAVKMTTISDYIAMKLCHNTTPIISTDMAASWGCFDLQNREFKHKELLDIGIELSYLPKVQKKHVIVGQTEEDIPVMCSLGDNQASVLGSVSSLSDTVLLNIGTGSQISIATENYISCQGSLELRPCMDGYLMVGNGLCGGKSYALLEQFYREVCKDSKESFYDIMNEQALEFLHKYGIESAWQINTTFSGTRDNALEKGSITGIGVDNFHPGAFTLGMIEGILNELHTMYEQICTLIEKKASRLVGSGNGIRQNPLMKSLAEEMFGMKMEIPTYKEEAACGAALSSLVVSGQVPSLEDVQKIISYI